MEFDISEFLEAFIEETKDNLESFNEVVIDLEKSKEDVDLMNNLFRVSHTLKGMAGTMGFENMRSLTHTMEDLLQDARDGKLAITTPLVNALFECHDYLEKCLESIINTSKESNDQPSELIEKLKAIHAGEESTQDVKSKEVEKTNSKPKKKTTAKKTTTKKDKEKEAETVEKVEELSFDEVKADETGDDENVYELSIGISGGCKFLVPRMFIILKTVMDSATVVESKPALDDLTKENYEATDYEINMTVKSNHIEDILDKVNSIPEIDNMSHTLISGSTANDETTSDYNNVEATEKTEGTSEGQSLSPTLAANQDSMHHKAEEYLRIASSKVDNLADMVGELMIVESLIEQKVIEKIADDPAGVKDLTRMSRLTKDIQNLSMSLRMVPLKSTLQKVLRTGRDTAQTLNKEIDFEIIGEETEIDRNIADKLYTPLMHMARNSIGHGIEDADARAKAGKSKVGKVVVEAYNKRGSIFIEVIDDGAGLNLDRILEKAIEKGLATEDKKYTDEDIANFIFAPGFSTAEKVDSISGRGVGMDVVKTDITKVGGTVRVETVAGQGTKFVLKIPINLAIMNGTIVKIMDKSYILPTLNIKEIVNVSDDSWISIKGKEKMLKVRGDVLPIYPIKELLTDSGFKNNAEDGEHAEKLMMLIELDGMVRAIPVQNVMERREIVVKSLGNEFKHLDFISGATILGDGTVALILDIEGLLKKVEQEA